MTGILIPASHHMAASHVLRHQNFNYTFSLKGKILLCSVKDLFCVLYYMCHYK